MSSLRRILEHHPPSLRLSGGFTLRRKSDGFTNEELPFIPSEGLPWWHPQRAYYRWVVLFAASCFSIGGYFAYDSLGVVQKEVQEYFNINEGKFGLLYSVYSFPNIVLPFFGGFLLDLIGIPLGVTLCCALVSLGCFIVAIAPSLNSFYLMLFGRFLFGVGSETSYVAQNTIICFWFKDGNILAFAMGVVVSAGRLGSWFTFSANSQIVEHFGNFQAALWAGFIFGSLAFFAALLYVALHYWALHVTKGTNIELNLPRSQPDIKLSQIFYFQPVFWIACAVCTIYYSAIFPFQSTATNLLETTHHFSYIKAANYIGLLPLTSFFLSPIFGFILDRIARRIYFVTLGVCIMIPAFALLATPDWPPLISIMCIGLAFSMVPAAIWPCIPLLVEEKYIGTSFGIISGTVNSGLTLFYWLQGELPHSESGTGEVWLFTSLVVLGLIVCLVWIWTDWKMGNLCNAVNPLPSVVTLTKAEDEEAEEGDAILTR